MAEHKVTFSIGSVFSGKGFAEAKQSVNTLNSNMKTAAGAAQKLAGAVGGMNTSASKAAGAMSGLLGVLASGSPTAIVLAGAVALLNKKMNELSEAQAEAKDAADKLQAAMQRLKDTKDALAKEALAKRVAEVVDEAKRLADEFDRAAANANKFMSALAKTEGAKDKGTILAMQLAKQSAVDNATMYDKELVAAQEDYKIQLERNAQALAKSQKVIDDARMSLQQLSDKEKMLRTQANNIFGEILKLQNERKQVSSSDLKKRKEYDKKIEELDAARSKIAKELQDIQTKRKVLEEDLATAVQERTNAEMEGKLKLREAEEKVIKARNDQAALIEERAEAEKKSAEEEEAERKKQQQKWDKAVADAANANAALAQAQSDYSRAQAAFMNNNMNLISQAANNNAARAQKTGMVGNQSLQNPDVVVPGANGEKVVMKAQEAASKWAITAGIADGSITNAKDAARAGRYAARAYRDSASSSEARQMQRDANRLAQLQNKAKTRPKQLTRKEKEELGLLEDLDNAKRKAGKDAEEAANKLKESEKKRDEAYDAVIKIKEWLEEHGTIK